MKPTTEREAQETLLGAIISVRQLTATCYALRYDDGRMVVIDNPVAHRSPRPVLAAPSLLRAAAELVERALGLLDLTEHPCPHCQRRVFANHDHAKVAERLEATPEKLRVSAGRLENAGQRDARPHVCVCQQPGAATEGAE